MSAREFVALGGSYVYPSDPIDAGYYVCQFEGCPDEIYLRKGVTR